MKAKHFIIQQLVGPEVFAARGEAAWELLDNRLILTLDTAVELCGRITVNNWHTGGPLKESGLRLEESKIGARFSQHKYGRAVDAKSLDIPISTFHAFLLSHPKDFPYLTTLEDLTATPTWVHLDVRNNSTSGIRIVTP